MRKERVILHSDANCFYASVEAVLDPFLRDKAVAVCGSTDERHGIVLAKSEKAKRAGIKTGMANWEAKKLCKDLIIVHPQYDYYLKFSRYLHRIYKRYTDLVEPFGLDECWLDVTDCKRNGVEIAEEIRKAVKDELGLTVSIGVSFNKIFAKLGSDIKKPDAVTEIRRDNFKEIVWKLGCSELLYCGRSSTAKLERMGICTIGDIARLPADIMQSRLGKNGVMLWRYANGLDESRVAHEDYAAPAKSVGHGITCTADLATLEEAKKVIVALSQDIGYKLRLMNLRAKSIHLYVRDAKLNWHGWQTAVAFPTQDEKTVSYEAYKLLETKYDWKNPIRSLTVSAVQLENINTPTQLGMFYDNVNHERRERLNKAVDSIRDSYGKEAIVPAIILDESKMPKGTLLITMNINVISQCEEFESNNENNYSVSLVVPLGEENFSITSTSSVPSGDSKVLACKGTISQNIFLVVSVVCIVIALILCIVLLAFVYFTKNEDINYVNKIKKILNSYRSFIQRIEGEFDTDGYQIVQIKSFVEMLGIRDTIQSPVLMWENKDETMTQFLIPTSTKILYVFEIKVANYDMIYGIKEEESGTVYEFETEDAIIIADNVDIEDLTEAMAAPDVVLENVDYIEDDVEDFKGTDEDKGIEVVGVVWPERKKNNKVYKYDPNGEALNEGDMVLVPTRDAAKDREVIRKAAIAHGNYHIDKASHPRMLKKIIGVIRRHADATVASKDNDKE